MPKGRQHTPSMQSDGRWLKEYRSHSPPISMATTTSHRESFKYKSNNLKSLTTKPFDDKYQKAFHNFNPFSIHDNRRVHETKGEYLDMKHGKRLLPIEKRKHSSVKEHLTVPSGIVQRPETVYRSTFVGHNEDLIRNANSAPRMRRYPHYHENARSIGTPSISSTTFDWYNDRTTKNVNCLPSLKLLLNKPDPNLSTSHWRYFYKCH